jgi:2-amino-4-hydroxy-6-hydroxymethyldihydropteridine diphosphokinase
MIVMTTKTDQNNIAYISIGSNLGDKLDNCRNGFAALGETDGIIVEDLSKYYQTEPMGYTDQPWFVNAAARILTSLAPLDLLKALKSLESEFGRINNVRFGPRTLDFDIIFYNDMVIEIPDLIIPHPRMYEREFVLRPICDLAPDLIHPVLKKSSRQLLADLAAENQKCIQMEPMIN